MVQLHCGWCGRLPGMEYAQRWQEVKIVYLRIYFLFNFKSVLIVN